VVSEQGSGMPFAKWTCYDTGLQSACIARWPGKIKPGSVSDALIEYIDVLPTFVAAAGATPDPVLQGKSLLPVLFGQTDHHKDYVFGEMTTSGIINGSPHFGIRSIRSTEYKYIINFTPETKFTNACSKSTLFQSWVRQAAQGDDDAADKVRRYHRRPAEELYAISNDVYEWNNLADDPQYATVKAELKTELTSWMKAQGDNGQETELAAREHQGRARKKSNAAAKKKKRQQKRAKSN
jgi:N-sulfoglucosamine sulfohydrolase